MGGRIECSLGIICGNESKRPLLIVIGKIILCNIYRAYMSLTLITDPCYHAVQIYIIVIIIQVQLSGVNLEELVKKVIVNLIIFCKYHLAF